MATLAAGASRLLVVDVQTRLLPAIDGWESLVTRVAALIEAADALGVPLLASEQYPQGLGPTVDPLATAIGDRRLAKVSFSALREPAIAERLADADGAAATLVLCGIEAHVCVLQTALDLAAAGRRVALVGDATGSRRAADHALALARARAHGIEVVGTEMVLFEWLERADSAAFRALQPRIKALAGA